MKWIALAILILLLLLLVIVMTKITVILNYSHLQDNDSLVIEIRAWFGLLKYKKDIPLIKIDDDSPTVVVKEKTKTGKQEQTKKEETKQFAPRDFVHFLHDTKELLSHVVNLHKIVKKFLKKVTVKDLEWHSMAGIGNAAQTGKLTGALWAAKGSLLGMISHYFSLKNMPRISITPNFQQAISLTKLSCIFQFRVGHAMVAGIKLVKFWKGGLPDFKSKPFSNLTNDKSKSS